MFVSQGILTLDEFCTNQYIHLLENSIQYNHIHYRVIIFDNSYIMYILNSNLLIKIYTLNAAVMD